MKNPKYDRSIGSKRIKYIMFEMLLKMQVMKNQIKLTLRFT